MKGRLFKKILFIIMILPIDLFAQQASLAGRDITGLWKGSLYNDTTQSYLPYEIAISEEKGKLSGYSYTLFEIDGKKELGVKSIKIKRIDDRLIIEDVELILNNYSAPPPRRVRQQSILHLRVNDSSMQLTGTWSTNRTREYSPLTGSLQLKRAIDFRLLVLFEKLVALKLNEDLSFVKAGKKLENTTTFNKASIENSETLSSVTAKIGNPVEMINVSTGKEITPVDENKPVEKSERYDSEITLSKTIIENPSKLLVAVPGRKPGVKIVAFNSLSKSTWNQGLVQSLVRTPVTEKIKAKLLPMPGITIAMSVIKEDSARTKIKQPELATKLPGKPPAISSPSKLPQKKTDVAIKEKELKVTIPVAIQKDDLVHINVETNLVKAPLIKKESSPSITPRIVEPTKDKVITGTLPVLPSAAIFVSERTTNQVQSVFFESDSLVLTLYDNGDVDGDTVSVLINGQILFAKQGLSTTPRSKTVYIEREDLDSISMIMYAENLGSIPPNTGLLIVMDGEKRHELRFSADLKTNAAILFRRNKKEK